MNLQDDIDKINKKENRSLHEEKILEINNRKQLSNVITLKDYDRMKVEDLLIFDKRNFLKFYFDSILTKHSFLKAFIFKTALIPFYIRIILFFLEISVSFALNAIFYSDSFISEKNKVVLTTNMVNLYLLLFFYKYKIS